VNETEPVRPARSPAGLQFSLFGFPTRIDASFLLIVALIGFDGTASHLGIWVALAVAAVLGHELGHALAARRMGATATISLQGLGGLTRSRRDEPLSRGESAILSVAGPAAGILLGLPVLWAIHATGWDSWTTGGYVLRTAAFTTLGWSALNLLPIIPLDGGHLLELALPGTPAARRRLAAQLSIGLAAGAGVVAYRAGMQYAALLALMFGAQNLAILKQEQAARPPVPRLSPTQAAQVLLQPLPPRPPQAPPSGPPADPAIDPRPEPTAPSGDA